MSAVDDPLYDAEQAEAPTPDAAEALRRFVTDGSSEPFSVVPMSDASEFGGLADLDDGTPSRTTVVGREEPAFGRDVAPPTPDEAWSFDLAEPRSVDVDPGDPPDVPVAVIDVEPVDTAVDGTRSTRDTDGPADADADTEGDRAFGFPVGRDGLKALKGTTLVGGAVDADTTGATEERDRSEDADELDVLEARLTDDDTDGTASDEPLMVISLSSTSGFEMALDDPSATAWDDATPAADTFATTQTVDAIVVGDDADGAFADTAEWDASDLDVLEDVAPEDDETSTSRRVAPLPPVSPSPVIEWYQAPDEPPLTDDTMDGVPSEDRNRTKIAVIVGAAALLIVVLIGVLASGSSEPPPVVTVGDESPIAPTSAVPAPPTTVPEPPPTTACVAPADPAPVDQPVEVAPASSGDGPPRARLVALDKKDDNPGQGGGKPTPTTAAPPPTTAAPRPTPPPTTAAPRPTTAPTTAAPAPAPAPAPGAPATSVAPDGAPAPTDVPADAPPADQVPVDPGAAPTCSA